ncbi:hypothetical protein JXA32_16765 [Candidatus Sumerlaeota bacterium]|nr:hypothetical protein [Candidatus Sumerlaeota bacterium]
MMTICLAGLAAIISSSALAAEGDNEDGILDQIIYDEKAYTPPQQGRNIRCNKLREESREVAKKRPDIRSEAQKSNADPRKDIGSIPDPTKLGDRVIDPMAAYRSGGASSDSNIKPAYDPASGPGAKTVDQSAQPDPEKEKLDKHFSERKSSSGNNVLRFDLSNFTSDKVAQDPRFLNLLKGMKVGATTTEMVGAKTGEKKQPLPTIDELRENNE